MHVGVFGLICNLFNSYTTAGVKRAYTVHNYDAIIYGEKTVDKIEPKFKKLQNFRHDIRNVLGILVLVLSLLW